MKLNLSLSHILCGVFGFLLGSAGGGAAAYGAKRRNPFSFVLGLFFSLIGAAVVFLSLIDRAVEEAEDEEDEEEAADAEENEAAEAAEAVKEAVEEVKEAVEEAAEAAKEVKEAVEDAEAPKEEA